MKRLNNKNSFREFETAVFNNFGDGDWFVSLTFPDNCTKEECERRFNNYIRRLRRAYKVKGKKIKYVYVKAIGDLNENLHYHILLNFALTFDEMIATFNTKKIDGGNCNLKKIYGGSDGLLTLIKYLENQMQNEGKEHKWECSRYLKRPQATVDDDTVSIEEAGKLRYNDADTVNRFIHRHYGDYVLINDTKAFDFSDNEMTGGFTITFYLKQKQSNKLYHDMKSKMVYGEGVCKGHTSPRTAKSD